MTTIAWPTDRAFQPAAFEPGPSVPKSGWRGFYTGTRETTSHAADRLTCLLTLGPCWDADARRREAFIGSLLSTGDWVTFPWFAAKYPLGTLGGTVTVNGAVSAGARSVVLAGARARPNVLNNSSFEIDSNADGIADSWSAYTVGSTGSVTRSLITAGTSGTKAQQTFASALAAGGGNRIGVVQTYLFTAGSFSRASLAFDARGTNTATVVIDIDWVDGGGSFISSSSASYTPDATNFQRFSVTNAAVPSNAARADCYCWLQNGTGGGCGLDVDSAQLEFNAAASAYAGFPTLAAGDFIGIGGNLLQTAYAGATANDAGAMTVPLVYPVQKAISSGAAVTWAAPTGTWALDTDAIPFAYSARVLQGGIVLPFRQVIV